MNPQEFGRASEDWAFQYLVSLGWVILDRNVNMRCGELDIVAMDGDELVVVEVRARHIGRGGAAERLFDPEALPLSEGRTAARARHLLVRGGAAQPH